MPNSPAQVLVAPKPADVLGGASDFCQRWRTGSHSWAHRRDGGFDQARYEVVELSGPVGHRAGRAFVTAHHYSKSWPAARLAYGLLEVGRQPRETDQVWDGVPLVGVAVLGVPVRAAVLTNLFPTLEPYTQSLELSRLVLLDEVPGNAETWFLTRAFTLAAGADIRGVVSFSDPLPRRAADGSMLSPGHVGTVYQARNALYTGQSAARRILMLADGTVLHERALAKVRGDEVGADGVVRRLVALGATAPKAGGDMAAWLREAVVDAGGRRVAHPGNHRYAFKLGRTRVERRQVVVSAAGLPFPKRAMQD